MMRGTAKVAMRTRASILIALGVSALVLSACDKGPLRPTVPKVEANKVEADAANRAPVGSTTVPAAASVIDHSRPQPKADVAEGRSNSAMTRAQESSAMPVAGQNNDHSAPLKSEERASAPKTPAR